MTESISLVSRLSRLFRRRHPVMLEVPLGERSTEADLARVETTRSSFLRPWAKYDGMIAQVQEGVQSLSSLIDSIRESLERQSRRQDEMLMYLSHLPRVLEELPETQRVQVETLKAITQQLRQQIDQQSKLAEILEKLSTSHIDQREVLEFLHQRVESLNQQNQSISDNLRHVGAAIESSARNSQSSSEALLALQENLKASDDRLEKTLQRQNTRFTILLIAAITLSSAALVAAGVIGYMTLKESL
jgi:chromosome segregation ATPase